MRSRGSNSGRRLTRLAGWPSGSPATRRRQIRGDSPTDVDRLEALAESITPNGPHPAVAGLRAAVAAGDLSRVATLADDFAATEAAAVLDHSARADADLQTARNWTRAVFILRLVVALFQASLDAILRRMAPDARTNDRERQRRASGNSGLSVPPAPKCRGW